MILCFVILNYGMFIVEEVIQEHQAAKILLL